MWRRSTNVISKTPTFLGRCILQQQHRCSSGASTSGGSAAKALLWTTGALTVGVGGAVGYAWYDPGFRGTIESNVPQTKQLFQQVLGEPRDSTKPLVDFPSVKQLGDKVTGAVASVLPSQKEEQKPSPSAAPPSPTPSQKAPAQSQQKSAVKESTLIQKGPKEDTKQGKDLEARKETKQREGEPEPAAAKSGDEDELRRQLRRQAAAHSENLEDALRAQQMQLDSKYRRELEEALKREREAIDLEIGSSIARLRAIESALEGRVEQDNENRRAKELWIACQQLKKSVLHGRAEGPDYPSRKKPLATDLAAIKEAGAVDPFVKALMGTIKSEAVSDGVYTQDDLVNRFQRVRKICRRTALVGENGGTLFQYFLSLVQSWLLVDRAKPDPAHLREVDPSNIDAFGILWRASYFVDHLDFASAVRLMLLLKGEPARLASDWINDARLHLETRRAVELLLAHASALSMRTIY